MHGENRMTSPHFTTSPHFGDVPTFSWPEKKGGTEEGKSIAGRLDRKCGDVAGAKMWGRLQVSENVGTSPDVPTFFPFMEMWGRRQNVGMS